MKKRNLFTALLAFVLLISSTAVYASSGSTVLLSQSTVEDDLAILAVPENKIQKIHFYVDGNVEYATIDSVEELDAATISAKQTMLRQVLPAELGSTDNKFSVTVQLDSNINADPTYKKLKEERSSLKTIQDVRNWRMRLVACSDSYHKKVISDSAELLNSISCKDMQVVDYSPFVMVTLDQQDLTSDALLRLANDSAVAHISVSAYEQESMHEEENVDETEIPEVIEESTTTGQEQIPTWNNVLQRIGAYNYVTNGTYTGENIYIGILEHKQCNPNYYLLMGEDVDLTLEDPNGVVDDHPSAVLYTAWKIAPEARYFSSGNGGRPYTGLTWMIGNACDIVNYSTGIEYSSVDSYNYKMGYDGLIDYLVSCHYIVFVKSAGNYSVDKVIIDPETGEEDIDQGTYGHITTPGYAHNIITVGGVVTYVNNNSTYVDHDTNSCYIDDHEDTMKPNICAFHHYSYTAPNNQTETKNGTSIAAPQVAGCIALFLEYKPELIAYPETVRALMQATAQTTHSYQYEDATLGKCFDTKVGAGVINLHAMIVNSNTIVSEMNDNKTSNYTVKSTDIFLLPEETINIALAWHAACIPSSSDSNTMSEILITDYDIEIYNVATGECVAATYSIETTNELLRYCPSTVGMYRITIYQYSAQDSRIDADFCVLAYYVSY